MNKYSMNFDIIGGEGAEIVVLRYLTLSSDKRKPGIKKS